MKIEVDGLEKLHRWSENLNKFSDKDSVKVPVTEFLTNDFLQEYTDFSDLNELIDKSGCNNLEELMNNEELDEFIDLNSEFSSLEELFNKCASIWFFNQIFEDKEIDLEINLML